MSRGISVSAVANLWKNRQSVAPTLTSLDIENALKPLFTYFDENFAIMKQTLTDTSMVMVMTMDVSVKVCFMIAKFSSK
jgi:hypothetical protein